MIIINNWTSKLRSKISENKIKLSFFNLLCPKFYKNSSYSQALNNIQEYMDIRNLIKRLQDVDKIKILLFDEKGLKEFETLPKPLAKQKNQNTENFISSQAHISEAIERSLYLKNLRYFINDNMKKLSFVNHELIKNQNLEKNSSFLDNSNFIFELLIFIWF